MAPESTYYDYDGAEQARLARDTIKEVINQFGEVLKQRHYYEYLKIYFELLNKDVGKEEAYYE